MHFILCLHACLLEHMHHGLCVDGGQRLTLGSLIHLTTLWVPGVYSGDLACMQVLTKPSASPALGFFCSPPSNILSGGYITFRRGDVGGPLRGLNAHDSYIVFFLFLFKAWL